MWLYSGARLVNLSIAQVRNGAWPIPDLTTILTLAKSHRLPNCAQHYYWRFAALRDWLWLAYHAPPTHSFGTLCSQHKQPVPWHHTLRRVPDPTRRPVAAIIHITTMHREHTIKPRHATNSRWNTAPQAELLTQISNHNLTEQSHSKMRTISRSTSHVGEDGGSNPYLVSMAKAAHTMILQEQGLLPQDPIGGNPSPRHPGCLGDGFPPMGSKGKAPVKVWSWSTLHCLQILTAETIKIWKFRTICLPILDQYVYGGVGLSDIFGASPSPWLSPPLIWIHLEVSYNETPVAIVVFSTICSCTIGHCRDLDETRRRWSNRCQTYCCDRSIVRKPQPCILTPQDALRSG